jgi:nicotinate-nucleotide--dimethylbenzimidazole phosphoribosyltransferase
MSEGHHSGPAPALPASDPAQPPADADSMRAAVARLTSAVAAGAPSALDRLRAELADLAQTVARAIAQAGIAPESGAIKPDAAADGKADTDGGAAAADLTGPSAAGTADAVSTLLHALDRIEAMAALAAAAAESQSAGRSSGPPAYHYIELPGDRAAAEAGSLAALELDHVPTVSHVVSQLNRANAPSSDDAAQVAPAATPDAATVSSLGAMVEALAAAMPAEQGNAAPQAREDHASGPQEADTVLPAQLTAPAGATPEAEVAAPAEPVVPEVHTGQPAPLDAAAESEAAQALAAQPATAEAVAEPEPRPEPEAPADPVAWAPPPADHAARAPDLAIAAPAEAALPPEPPAAEIEVPEARAEPPVPPEAAVEREALAAQPATSEAFAAPEAYPGSTAPAEIASTPPAVDPAAPAADPARPPVMPESALLSSFARMEAVPFLPAELGTAVIFQPRPAEPEPPVEPQAAAAAAAAAWTPPEPDPASGPNAAPEPEAPSEAATAPVVATTPAGPVAATSLDHASTPVQPPAEASTPAAASDPAANALDLDGFLFEPQPEEPGAGPADFLLEPATRLPPAPSFIRPSEPPAPERPKAGPPPVTEDPLAPLKTMSDEEKIALFS